MREAGVRHVLIYCTDHNCSHHIEVSADCWPDHVRLSDIEPGFVCTACGRRGDRHTAALAWGLADEGAQIASAN